MKKGGKKPPFFKQNIFYSHCAESFARTIEPERRSMSSALQGLGEYAALRASSSCFSMMSLSEAAFAMMA